MLRRIRQTIIKFVTIYSQHTARGIPQYSPSPTILLAQKFFFFFPLYFFLPLSISSSVLSHPRFYFFFLPLSVISCVSVVYSVGRPNLCGPAHKLTELTFHPLTQAVVRLAAFSTTPTLSLSHLLVPSFSYNVTLSLVNTYTLLIIQYNKYIT